MRRYRLLITIVSVLLMLLPALPAQAIDFKDVAQRFVKSGEKPHPGGPQRPPGPNSGPIGGAGGNGRPQAPDYQAQEEALITELLVMLVGHAQHDLARGAELYSAQQDDKHLNFLRYTAGKVISALELDPRDGSFAPVLAAVQGGSPAAISQAAGRLDGELRSGIGTDLGPDYLWYYEAGQNISRLEFAIWEQSGFNMLHFYGKSASLQISFQTPAAASAGDLAAALGELATGSGRAVDMIELVKRMLVLRTLIEERYGYGGSGMVLWSAGLMLQVLVYR